MVVGKQVRYIIQAILNLIKTNYWKSWIFACWVVVVYVFFFLQFLSYAAELREYLASLMSALG